SAARALTLEQRREDASGGAERSRGQVGDLHRRQRRSGVCEQAGPALVVEVVAGPKVPGAETGDRAVDDGGRQVIRADAQALDHARPEALEHDVGLAAELAAALRFGLEVELERLLAGVQRVVPGRRELAQGVAAGRLEPEHARPEAEQ